MKRERERERFVSIDTWVQLTPPFHRWIEINSNLSPIDSDTLAMSPPESSPTIPPSCILSRVQYERE